MPVINGNYGNVVYQTLDSGMIAATDNMPQVRTVALVVQVNTGSNNETVENHGISHFLEHMAFKGTSTRSAIQIAQEFDAIGGYFNAYTSREKTVYYAKVLREDLHIAAGILGDILQHSIFADEEIAKEKDVILQEIAQTNDAPDDIVFDTFHETAYPDQSFGRSILGTQEKVEAIDRAKIVRYVKDNYFASNIVVSAAGLIEQHELVSIIHEHFSGFPSHGNKYQEDVHYTGGGIAMERDLEQVHMVLGFNGISYLDPEFYTYQVLGLIAGGGMSSRLFQEIRENLGLAYSVSAYNSSYASCGMFNLYAATSPQKANQCMEVMLVQLKNLITDITDHEIKRSKSQVRANLIMSQESVVQRAEKLASQITSFGRYIPIEETIEKVNMIDSNALYNAARHVISGERKPTIATIGKVKGTYGCDTLMQLLQQV
jgi:predicted Zn-dependent peptidase